jgi:hypothetical protein
MLLYDGGDHERAQLLASAMQRWITQRQTDAAGVPATTVEEMTKWLAKRSEISGQGGKSATGTWK